MKLFPPHMIDFYKSGHIYQYPKGTEMVYSNFTPRSDKLKNIPDKIFKKGVIVFGTQYFIKCFLIDMWNDEFFNKPKEEVIAKFKRRMDTSLGVDAVKTDHMEALHDLGYLPLIVKALPEGVLSPMKVPVLVVYNTLPEFYWLTNYIESVMSSYLWKPMTSATVAYHYKTILDKWSIETGSAIEFVNFQAHDFSFRGMSGPEDAALSGAAHLTSFVGTDTVHAIDLVEQYYNADATKELIGCSVPATEHSVMCSGSKDDEIGTFRRLLTEVYPRGILSVVSDTWDLWKVVTEYVTILKTEIMSRSGGPVGDKLVIRPDSGDPVEILCGIDCNVYDTIEAAKDHELDIMRDQAGEDCEGSHNIGNDTYESVCKVGDKYFKIVGEFEYNRHDKTYYYVDSYDVKSVEEITLTPQQKGVVECLWDVFGGTLTSTGHKLLDSHIGVIYGDSITLERADMIMSRLAKKGFAAGNVVFGVGSYTYQHVTRDTFGMAVKSTFVIVDGEHREIFKDPVTDSGVKKSARGLLKVVKEDGQLVLKDQQTTIDSDDDELVKVFENGKLLVDESFSNIRARIRSSK